MNYQDWNGDVNVVGNNNNVGIVHADDHMLQHLRITDPRDDKQRIEATKGGLLEGSYRWILENAEFQRWHNDQQSQLLWIKGDPGKGKTMLLCGIINELNKPINKSFQLSYFFCQATDSRLNNATSVLRGLISMLVDQQPSLILHVRRKYDFMKRAVFDEPNAWYAMSEIFTNILQDPSLNTTYLIIDALDECETRLPELLKFVVEQSSLSSVVKWVVSSRNLPDIGERIEQVRHKARLCLELNANSVSMAVSTYIQHKLRMLVQLKKYNDKTRDAVREHLFANADNTFLWVALVCQNLEKIPQWSTIARLKAFPPGLDSLYERMKKEICESHDADLCKRIMASVAIVYRPITLQELTAFVEELKDMADDLESLRDIIGRCGSFLTIRGDIVYFVHQSAKEFLLERSSEDIFPFSRGEMHGDIFSRSVQVLAKSLERDMYRLGTLGYSIERVQRPQPDPLAAIRYSCIYWVDHLCDWSSESLSYDNSILESGRIVDSFLREKFLHWLEALSLCKSVSKGALSIVRLGDLIKRAASAASTMDVVKDAHRFIMYHKLAIESGPLQAYGALLFSPTRSVIRELFRHEEPQGITIMPEMPDRWSHVLQTFEGHNEEVNSVVFSHDSTRLASASEDGTIKVWDVYSGECLRTLELEGHNAKVKSAAFSHDSTQLASGSEDGTVKVWDAYSGECLQILKDHSAGVNSVAFSHESTWLASASKDGTVRMWNSHNGRYLDILKGHSAGVDCVVFSHDSTRLASASQDGTVRIWNSYSCECLHTLTCSDFPETMSVCFSHDSTLLLTSSRRDFVSVWDAGSGKFLRKFPGERSIPSVAFSHDSTLIASLSDFNKVRILDSALGECVQVLEGHNGDVCSVAFSHDSTRLASAGLDKTIILWDLTDQSEWTLDCHDWRVSSVCFFQDSTKLASSSDDCTVRIWEVSTGECLQKLEHDMNVHSVAVSQGLDLLAGVCETEVKIWDALTYECLSTFECRESYFTLTVFSYDSTLVASARMDGVIEVFFPRSGKPLSILKGHHDLVTSLAFSCNSTLLASASENGTINVWDVYSGNCVRTLKDLTDYDYRNQKNSFNSSIVFSDDATKLATASDRGIIRVWDRYSGTCTLSIQVGERLKVLSFAASSTTLLHTDIGTIDTLEKRLQYQNMRLKQDCGWIRCNGQELIWIPSDFQPSCEAVSGNVIAFGVGNGRVWICKLQS